MHDNQSSPVKMANSANVMFYEFISVSHSLIIISYPFSIMVVMDFRDTI